MNTKIKVMINKTMRTYKMDIERTSAKISLGELIPVRVDYFHELSLFVAHFDSIRNLISEINIDCKRANRWFEKQYQSERIKEFQQRKNNPIGFSTISENRLAEN